MVVNPVVILPSGRTDSLKVLSVDQIILVTEPEL